ncbi:mannosyltransferase [Brucella sp. NF 2653]|uniref:glycosyltransferase family 4 protein n=1 Tax=unclassified Brucella TaxID=2632610 RepID=UPI0001B4864E|nr:MULTISPECIES: glycosyltransferase family 1 protein [unclassified Brucella]EFM61017.1 mannosyltransferase [Brucella sp. NF 2653]
MRIGVDARNLVNNITGISRYVIENCRELCAQGHELVLYTPEKPRVQLPYSERLDFRVSNFQGAIGRLFWSQTVLPLQLKKDKIDVFWGPAHRLPALKGVTPSVVSIHDLVWYYASSTMRLQGWLADRFLMKGAIRNADQIVAVSCATSSAIASVFPQYTTKIQIVYPGVSHFTRNDQSNILKDYRINKSYGLFIGTLEPRKNLIRILEAYAQLPEFVQNNFLLVVAGGKGWILEDLGKKINQLGIAKYIRLTGYVKDSDLGVLYRNARTLLMPSLYEGFGLPIIEAQAYGVPAITSNCSSMPEVAGDAAILVDPLSVAEISNALYRIATDDKLWQQKSLLALQNVERFNWRKSVTKLEDVFSKARESRK